jgi:hypothetical protein
MMHYKNHPLIFFDGGCKVILEQVIMAYRDSGNIYTLPLTSMLNEDECPLPNPGYFTHKIELGCALYRRLDESDALSLVADRLLCTP